MPINPQYNIAAPDSLAVRIAGYQRRKMFRAFLAIGITASDTILDVGVTSDRSYDHSNYLEAWYSYKSKITAVGIDEGAAFLRQTYPGVRYVKGDGRSLPFADDSFDYVHSSAVLEHVGNAVQQMAFIAEARRVAQKGVFLTTPNRWYPIEFHTVLPVAHWLPRKIFRRILVMSGKEFFASEQNLNLLSARQLRRMAKDIGFWDDYRVHGVRLVGLVSNVIFVLQKKPETPKTTIRESAPQPPEISSTLMPARPQALS
jgi:ubiquinone/menaquinone biosynthesis C-methylase UbiE